MADHMRGELTLAALRMAIARQRPEPGLIAHSDRGVQYAAEAYRAALAAARRTALLSYFDGGGDETAGGESAKEAGMSA